MTAVAEVRGRALARPGLLGRPLTSYYLVLGCGLLLAGLGLVMVLSASSVSSYEQSGSAFAVFQKQLTWVAIGVPAMALAVRLPVRAVRWLVYPLLFASLAGLVLVLVPRFGAPSVFGATRWIELGPVRAQPSELAKLALALWGADVLARKERLLGDWKHLLVPLLPVGMTMGALVMLEPDLGTTLVLAAVVFALLYVAGVPHRLYALLLGSGALLVLLLAVAEPYRMQRLTSYLNPRSDLHDSGWQAVQGLYALGSGGWFGVGLGQSGQKWQYLPNAHTDYIFAILGEELGLVGTLFVVLLFGLLAYAGVRVAQRSRDPFVRLAATGITAWLLVQAIVNMGAVTGLLPITGIPLPLISFGGSSLGVSLFALGILAAFARQEPAAREALARRGPSVGVRARRTVLAYYGFGPAPRPRARPRR